MKGGTEFKFKTRPIDPNDPFRGKYITLHYSENKAKVSDNHIWEINEPIFVSLAKDSAGFAKIETISKSISPQSLNNVIAKISFILKYDSTRLNIDYPFDRYYMEESKAYQAELTYRQSRRDPSKTTYALVNIKNGNAVLKDVLINEVSIRKIVKETLLKQKKLN